MADSHRSSPVLAECHRASGMTLAGTPAERWVQMNPAGYQALAQRHRAGARPV